MPECVQGKSKDACIHIITIISIQTENNNNSLIGKVGFNDVCATGA